MIDVQVDPNTSLLWKSSRQFFQSDPLAAAEVNHSMAILDQRKYSIVPIDSKPSANPAFFILLSLRGQLLVKNPQRMSFQSSPPDDHELDDIGITPIDIPCLWVKQSFFFNGRIHHKLKSFHAWKKPPPSQVPVVGMGLRQHEAQKGSPFLITVFNTFCNQRFECFFIQY